MDPGRATQSPAGAPEDDDAAAVDPPELQKTLHPWPNVIEREADDDGLQDEERKAPATSRLEKYRDLAPDAATEIDEGQLDGTVEGARIARRGCRN